MHTRAGLAEDSSLNHHHQQNKQTDPYSIREAVALIKHLQAFPEDGVLNALPNVLGFDQYGGPDLRRTLADVFRRRGCEKNEDCICVYVYIYVCMCIYVNPHRHQYHNTTPQ